MEQLRPLIHDIFNAISIAQGMTETVKDSLLGNIELSDEDKLLKIEKTLKALERIEKLSHEMREQIKASES